MLTWSHKPLLGSSVTQVSVLRTDTRLAAWDEAPRLFVWTETVEKIMEKISRARNRLDKIKLGWAQRKKRKKRT